MCVSDVSEDLFDLLNIPDSPDHQLFTPEPGDQAHDESSSSSVPHSPIPFTLPPANKKSFQKDVLKLMMDGIKISLVLQRSDCTLSYNVSQLSRCSGPTGQHGSRRCSQPSVEEDPVVLPGHVQSPDRSSPGAHAEPRPPSERQEGGARVCVRSQTHGHPEGQPEPGSGGESVVAKKSNSSEPCHLKSNSVCRHVPRFVATFELR